VNKIVNNLGDIAVLGLGEAGRAIATDLARAGASVVGWDPVAAAPDGVRPAAGPVEAVGGAGIVLSVNSAAVARDVIASVAPALATVARDAAAEAPPPATDVIFADLNTSSPALKAELATTVEAAGASFADVALLAPVPGRGLATPALASGSGAEALAAALNPLGAAIEALGPRAGEAAERKLLRSVFVKGMAMAALEGLAAARAAGCEDWARGQLVELLDAADAALLERWEKGSVAHAARRAEEMSAAAAMLAELQVPAPISAGAAQAFRELNEEGAGVRN